MVSLTSQEKKVLGFIVIMVGLGLVMLAAKRLAKPAAQTGIPASAVATNTGKIR